MEYTFRPAKEADIPALLALLEQGKQYLAACGIDQWQGPYPDSGIVAEDVAKGYALLLLAHDIPAAALTLQSEPEPTYAAIYDGAWLTPQNTPYATIHRVASAAAFRGKGASVELYKRAEARARQNGAPSIRVDTHPQNQTMQGFLRKCGFTPCGTIYLADGAQRIAYEKIL